MEDVRKRGSRGLVTPSPFTFRAKVSLFDYRVLTCIGMSSRRWMRATLGMRDHSDGDVASDVSSGSPGFPGWDFMDSIASQDEHAAINNNTSAVARLRLASVGAGVNPKSPPAHRLP